VHPAATGTHPSPRRLRRGADICGSTLAQRTVRPRDRAAAVARIGDMRKLLALATAVFVLLLPAPGAAMSSGRPVALVTAETANEVLAVSLGKYGGHILRRVHLLDPLMIATARHGPAVVVSPRGTVTLLAWHSLRPIKTLSGFSSPEVAEVTPNERLAYVTDGSTGDLTTIDLQQRRILARVFVGAHAHHFGISPDGRRIWVALGETATTIVRLDSSNPRQPRVIGRFHPRFGAHDVAFAPDGRTVLVRRQGRPCRATAQAAGSLDCSGTQERAAGPSTSRSPVAARSSQAATAHPSRRSPLRRPSRAPRTAAAPYGSFNLATYGGLVVATSLFTGQVTEFRASDLHRLWTAKVAPAARYVAISVWPH
jgi:hypothetical protein